MQPILHFFLTSMLIQTYQSQEPSVAKKFHDDDDPNNVHNDCDGGGYRVRENDDENHDRDCDVHCVHENDSENHDRDCDVHCVHENDSENHDVDYDVHSVHESVLHDDVFLHLFFDSIIDSILV